ncbi:MAG: hypothetical protein WKG07_17380 [Hymenobacter sp.]
MRPLSAASSRQALADETWRKSIPAQVFLNYFFAINYHIQESDDLLGGLQHLPFSAAPGRAERRRRGGPHQAALHRAGARSTRPARTAELGDDNFLRNALHWTFPQAYHAILSGLQSFSVHHRCAHQQQPA